MRTKNAKILLLERLIQETSEVLDDIPCKNLTYQYFTDRIKQYREEYLILTGKRYEERNKGND